MCYVELQLHRVTQFVVLMYNLYLAVICFQYKITSIKSDTIKTLKNLIGCPYSYYFVDIL